MRMGCLVLKEGRDDKKVKRRSRLRGGSFSAIAIYEWLACLDPILVEDSPVQSPVKVFPGHQFANDGDPQPCQPSAALPKGGKYCQSRGGHVVLTHSTSEASTSITVTGGAQESSFLPPRPPPLVHCPRLSFHMESPCDVTPVRGNMSQCRECRQFGHVYLPLDLCVGHKAYGIDPCRGQYGNVQCCCNVTCTQSCCPSQMLQIPSSVAVKLVPVHAEYILKDMQGRL